jgi:hypothetical protein
MFTAALEFLHTAEYTLTACCILIGDGEFSAR